MRLGNYNQLIADLINEGKTDFEIIKGVFRFYDIHPGCCPLYRTADREAMRFILQDIVFIRRHIKSWS